MTFANAFQKNIRWIYNLNRKPNKMWVDKGSELSMPSTSKIVYIDKLDIIVNKYNDPYQKTIKMNLLM